MAIQDDFTIDYVNQRITYTTAFSDDRPADIYTVNELYSYLQDVFDEPAQMDDPIPMSAQTPTQYTFLYPWFIDNESAKALYGGSIQSSSWAKSGANGITALRWQDTPTQKPVIGDVGDVLTGAGAATGVILWVDDARQVVWVRNTHATQFVDGEAVTSSGPADFDIEADNGVLSGENIWANLFSVGSLQSETEIYVGQEPDQQGGTAYHDTDADSLYERRIEKLDEWWDSDVDFFTGSPNLLGGAGHFDILVLTTEMGVAIDGQRLAIFSRQFSKIYSHFELVGGVGNFVVPFASTGSDLNAADGPYNALFNNRTGTTLAVGDVLENDAGESIPARLRAVVTAVVDGDQPTGDFDYYLIGENEPLTTTDRTLVQLGTGEGLDVRTGVSTCNLDINGAPTQIATGPSDDQGVTITFADNQVDIDEDTTPEEYACTIDCNDVALAAVYKYVMFLCSRGNQDGTTPDAQDLLLPSGHASLNEAGEFYRAVGDISFDYNGGVGTQPTEGDLVTNGTGSYGVVVSVTAGATGKCVLTQVKGTFLTAEDVFEIDAVTTPTTNKIVINGAPSPIVDNTGAPFGAFAGGRWFVAQGIVLTGVPTGDANNWETIDLDGNRVVPPAVRAITFAGLSAGDRGAIFEVITAAGTDIQKSQDVVGGAGAAISDTAIPLDSTVELDVPTSGWVRIVDTSSTTGVEYRFEYSAVAGTTITLRPVSPDPGTCTSLGTSTELNDTGQFATFGTDGQCKIGHEIRNITTGAIATIVRKVDNNQIITTPLSSGLWNNSDTYEVNQVVVALVAADTIYFPYIDDVATGATLSASIKYVGPTELLARARFSPDPGVGGQRSLPFELTDIQLGDADLTVTAILNDDLIAS